jgi:hypothetical protein
VAASLPGANVNLLHDPALTDTFSGTAAVNNTWVAVTRASVDSGEQVGVSERETAPTA